MPLVRRFTDAALLRRLAAPRAGDFEPPLPLNRTKTLETRACNLRRLRCRAIPIAAERRSLYANATTEIASVVTDKLQRTIVKLLHQRLVTPGSRAIRARTLYALSRWLCADAIPNCRNDAIELATARFSGRPPRSSGSDRNRYDPAGRIVPPGSFGEGLAGAGRLIDRNLENIVGRGP